MSVDHSVPFDLMTSAVVFIANNAGTYDKCKILLDTCSTSNFITEKLARQLNLPRTRCFLTIEAINEMNTTINSFVKVTLKSTHSEFKKSLTCFIVPKITNVVPTEAFPREKINIPSNLKLADPDFHKPSNIDILIGAGPTLSLFCTGQIKLSQHDDLILQKTKLGWIIGGNINLSKITKTSYCMTTNLQFDLEKFWVLENVSMTKELWSTDELNCENHFKENTTRDKDGKFVVALPFRTNNKLGESRKNAMRRLSMLQKRFARDNEFERDYASVMSDYINLGHMSLIQSPITSDGFFLPHHAILKDSSNTTRLRVVFDASAKSSNGVSLNDNLLIGPTIQDDLFSILLRFRLHTFVVIADIEKMYRQILVQDKDRKFQKILWFHNDQIREYTLNTVTFGIASAPFLAIRCLHQLAEDNIDNFPLAAKILKNDMYVDNMLTGTNSKHEAQEFCQQVTEILRTAGMKMRQWASNDQDVLQGIAEKDLDVNFHIDQNHALKTLGVSWRAKADVFVYEIKKIQVNNKITIRQILSLIARIFDPIGLLGPIILFTKRIMQDIWQSKIDWDESVPSNIFYSWNVFCNQLNSLTDIRFDRQVITPETLEIQIHGFSDASQTGYGAVLYLRSKCPDDTYHVALLCSKSRIAPLKTRTIPQLELCGMQLLVDLLQRVYNAIKIKVNATYLWSDSSIALNWINSQPGLFKTFVANRVADIQTKSDIKNWHHVRSCDNPADALSRGQLPHDFISNTTWYHGPSWLQNDINCWPQSIIPGINDLPERRKASCLVVKDQLEYMDTILKRYSSFKKLIRIIALCLRFKKSYRRPGIINLEELERAEKLIIKLIQNSNFKNEIEAIKTDKSFADKNRLMGLDPFIDDDGILRVGGRIRKAMIPFASRHPIILPQNNHVTDLIITHYHIINLHTGAQNTLHAIRERFWPIRGQNQIKRVIRKCIRCFRAKPSLLDYKIGNLPSVRIQQSRPFNNVGIDYCGPFMIKEKKYQNRKMIKCYAAIFICMVVKAVHIELVEDLSTDAFLGALSRFISRRGLPQAIYSDNGTNFRGAHNELNDLYNLLQSVDVKTKVTNFSNQNKIQWHFIPPHAPNFGGLWEATVKQFKHHFKRVAYDKRFTFVEFYTFSSEVEAILNSRPLTQLSTDVNDLTALTPGHFLIGGSLRRLPEHDYEAIPSNRLNVWENITKIKREFWKRWHKEYLNSLNVRYKLHNKTTEPKVGLLVTLKEDNIPSMDWNLGRIVQLHPGTDKIVRTVTIMTKGGLKKRPTTKIAILSTEDSINEN